MLSQKESGVLIKEKPYHSIPKILSFVITINFYLIQDSSYVLLHAAEPNPKLHSTTAAQ